MLKPSFGITTKEIRNRFEGDNYISSNCGLVLEGPILVKDLNLKNGFLHLNQNSENLSLDDEKSNP